MFYQIEKVTTLYLHIPHLLLVQVDLWSLFHLEILFDLFLPREREVPSSLHVYTIAKYDSKRILIESCYSIIRGSVYWYESDMLCSWQL